MKSIHLVPLLIAWCFFSSLAVAQSAHSKPHYLGAFSNVKISQMSGDCDGISIQLWASEDGLGKHTMSGTFYDASGECPGSSSQISGVNFDSSKGKFEFNAVNIETGIVVAEFRGIFGTKKIRGLFGWRNGVTGIVDSWDKIELLRLSKKEWKLVGVE